MDDLITQLMEQGQPSTGPPPASADLIDSLPRSKADKSLVEGDKECTICKEGFNLNEDVTHLPCSHVLYIPSLYPNGSHQDCILPWLKINGSCPVCRHTLSTPDPATSQSNQPTSPSTSTSTSASTSSPPRNRDTGSGAPWLSNLFSFGGRSGNGGGDTGANRQPGRRRSDSIPEEDLD
jgi:E3 ubiquitin-protein ligase RNF115/126